MIDYKNHIESNPAIMFGKPCVKGTRIPVQLILRRISAGWTIEDLLEAYPRLTKENITACADWGKKKLDTRGLLLTIIN
jgi:uncharacterized protein (DUF433 family)